MGRVLNDDTMHPPLDLRGFRASELCDFFHYQPHLTQT
jgi:hypothetical protein